MQFIVAVTIAYLMSRGLAKVGGRERYDAQPECPPAKAGRHSA
ncbi:hypothetical protein [Frondihabitans sucicola]|nr:hypothetical protein [Frondihabitans sucicola]